MTGATRSAAAWIIAAAICALLPTGWLPSVKLLGVALAAFGLGAVIAGPRMATLLAAAAMIYESVARLFLHAPETLSARLGLAGVMLGVFIAAEATLSPRSRPLGTESASPRAVTGAGFAAASLCLLLEGATIPSAVAFGVIALATLAAARWMGEHDEQEQRLAQDAQELATFVRHARKQWKRRSLTPVPLKTPEARRIAESIQQMTDGHRADFELHAQTRAATEETRGLKTLFMAYMSHDLRSPLNSITGFSELLAFGTDGPLNDDQLESVTTIRESGAELLRLVNAVVDSAKLEAGRLELKRAFTPAVSLLTEAVGQAREGSKQRQVEFETTFQAGMPAIYVDRPRMLQAIVGLLIQVVAMMDRGRILVGARIENHERFQDDFVIHIQVSEGMPERGRERLFEALRVVKQQSGRRVSGLGLGLSLARALVEHHGGSLTYETQGAHGRFRLALPMMNPEP